MDRHRLKTAKIKGVTSRPISHCLKTAKIRGVISLVYTRLPDRMNILSPITDYIRYSQHSCLLNRIFRRYLERYKQNSILS